MQQAKPQADKHQWQQCLIAGQRLSSDTHIDVFGTSAHVPLTLKVKDSRALLAVDGDSQLDDRAVIHLILSGDCVNLLQTTVL